MTGSPVGRFRAWKTLCGYSTKNIVLFQGLHKEKVGGGMAKLSTTKGAQLFGSSQAKVSRVAFAKSLLMRRCSSGGASLTTSPLSLSITWM